MFFKTIIDDRCMKMFSRTNFSLTTKNSTGTLRMLQPSWQSKYPLQIASVAYSCPRKHKLSAGVVQPGDWPSSRTVHAVHVRTGQVPTVLHKVAEDKVAEDVAQARHCTEVVVLLVGTARSRHCQPVVGKERLGRWDCMEGDSSSMFRY